MAKPVNRRSFLRIAGTSIGVGALYRALPVRGAGAAELMAELNGESLAPFTFVQMSDTHVGFAGPPNPLGTAAFERAVEVVNGLPERPDLILFTGDLTHDSEKEGEAAARMRRFREIASRLLVKNVRYVPGEHDAAIDGGVLFREFFGPTHYAFDQGGIHFVALDNVSFGKPRVGSEQIAWLRKDLARFSRSTPIVVFTHRPLFDLQVDWEWFTGDGDEVLNVLEPYENVTVLYGHIHRRDSRTIGRAGHHAARSLIFAFPDPAVATERNPIPFDPEKPFRNLGIRQVRPAAGASGMDVADVELTIREYAGTAGISQIRKGGLVG